MPKNFLKGYRLLQMEKRFTYAKDCLYTFNNCDFISEERFKKAYIEGKKTGSWGNEEIEWRVYVVLYFAKIASKLEGDFVECGVNRGGLCSAIFSYLEFQNLNKTFYLLDTFNGFDESLLSNGELKSPFRGYYSDCYSDVLETFSKFKNVSIIKGSIPSTLDQVKSEKISFLSVDLNCAAPEVSALDYFYPKLVLGGIIVLDDFGFPGFESQFNAEKEWAKNTGIEILALPTGQGIIIKTK